MEGLLLLFDGIHLEGGIGMAALYAVLGFVFVFLGITLLILILTVVGKIMEKINARGEREESAAPAPIAEPLPEIEEGISPETVAAITAALAVVLEEEHSACDFVVRRIKKI